MKSYCIVLCFLTLFIIFTFTASYAQTDWIKYTGNPVLMGGASGSWDRLVMMPSVLYNSDSSRYEMWYAANPESSLRPKRIGFATSPDGITWTKIDTAVLMPTPGTWDESTVEWPKVIKENGLYKMWYTGWCPDTIGIGYATSLNGVDWTKDTQNSPVMRAGTAAWDEGGRGYCTILPVPGGYKMWYTGLNATYSEANIGYATSPNGINWTTHPDPVLITGASGQWDNPKIWSASVVFIDSIYHMFYSGQQSSSNVSRRVGWATSVDGMQWIKYDDPNTTSTLYVASDPVLSPTYGQWDGSKIEAGTVLHEGDSLRMWYSGWVSPAPPNRLSIGHATAQLNMPVTIHVPGHLPTIQSAIDFACDGNIVLVDTGTYYENINFKGKAITVASHFYIDGDTSHIANTIIDGSQPSNPDSGSVVYFISGEDTTSILCGFTITAGSGTYSTGFDMYLGGGIQMQAGGKVLYNKILSNHLVSQKACWGAGMVVSSYNMSGNIVIEYNEFIDNSIVSPLQSGGGGIHIPLRWWTGGYCRVKNNVISHNSVTVTGTYKALAGGIMLSFNLPTMGEVSIESNIISYNDLHCIASVGAGIYVVYFDPGYAIVDENPTPLICNNIITNNYSESMGGGLAIWTVENGHISGSVISPQPAIINNTIVNNSAADGCGLFNFDSYPLLLNNIMWDDLSQTGSNEIFDTNINYPPYVPPYHDPYNDGEVFVRYSDIQDTLWPGIGNNNTDPFFADSTFNLSDSSLCIGSGIDSIDVGGTWYYAPLHDFNGDPRPNSVDEYIDIGAQESPYPFIIPGFSDDGLPEIPKIFSLKQNYPNPFNPITTIEFSIPKTENVNLKIFNLLGQEVATLVSDKLTPGEYKYTWDASHLASGVYYYRLTTDSGFDQSRKLLLMK